MNREILYRGKRVDTEKWIEGFLMHYECMSIPKNDEEHTCILISIIPETVGEYTGLTDKSGKKIFENDILLGAWHTKLIVYYDDCYLGFRAREVSGRENDISYYDNGKLEVIGNIHDNPELLEVKL